MNEQAIKNVLAEVLTCVLNEVTAHAAPHSDVHESGPIPVELSARHVHLSEQDAIALFGAPLSHARDLSQPGQFLCGFSMETENLIENSRKKLIRKNLDIVAANSLKEEGAGFGVSTNVLTLITREDETQLPLLTKEEAAHRLLDRIAELRGERA